MDRLEEAGCAATSSPTSRRTARCRARTSSCCARSWTRTPKPVIASGGIPSLDDIAALRELVPHGLEGAIVGKALYAGAFTLAEALDVAGATDPADRTRGDSAGVPVGGRGFERTRHAGDDGSRRPERCSRRSAAFRARRARRQAEVVDACATRALLIPLVAERATRASAPHGLLVDKTQELSIVTVAGPDGRRVLPVFTSVEAMREWDAAARPIPVDGVRVALAAAGRGHRPHRASTRRSPTEFVIRRPAFWAIATGERGAVASRCGASRRSSSHEPVVRSRSAGIRRRSRPSCRASLMAWRPLEPARDSPAGPTPDRDPRPRGGPELDPLDASHCADAVCTRGTAGTRADPRHRCDALGRLGARHRRARGFARTAELLRRPACDAVLCSEPTRRPCCGQPRTVRLATAVRRDQVIVARSGCLARAPQLRMRAQTPPPDRGGSRGRDREHSRPAYPLVDRAGPLLAGPLPIGSGREASRNASCSERSPSRSERACMSLISGAPAVMRPARALMSLRASSRSSCCGVRVVGEADLDGGGAHAGARRRS